MGSRLIYGVHENPIIAAINNAQSLDAVLETNIEVIFLLKGNILELQTIIQRVREKKKCIFIHADLVEGLSKDVNGLNYIIDIVKPDGIITTKSHLVKVAKARGLMAIQRLFILDSLNLKTGIESSKSCNPDAIEILPGIMPSVTKEIVEATNKPIITGGLIKSKDDVINSLQSGAIGISTSNQEIWKL